MESMRCSEVDDLEGIDGQHLLVGEAGELVLVFPGVVDAEALVGVGAEFEAERLDVGEGGVEDGVVAPVVGVGREACGDVAAESGDIDDVGVVGAFFEHEGAAAVFGGLAHVDDLGARTA